MEIVSVICFLVHPGKNLENPEPVHGTILPLEGSLYSMLKAIFTRSDNECNIPIYFRMAEGGTQNNEVRECMIGFLESPDLDNGGLLATRLRDFTTQVPGLGLFFLILGQDGATRKLVLSRFPAEQGVLAELGGGGLEIEFIERIFMKNAASYKAALYNGVSFEVDFWSGFAVDKQMRSTRKQIADYWIQDFLASDFLTTTKAGTNRIAIAFRRASQRAPNIQTKQEIVSATNLLPGLDGEVISLEEVMDNYNLSEEAKTTIISGLPHEGLVSDSFVLDREEFIRYATYHSVELDNGGFLQAPLDQFNDSFQRVTIDQKEQIYRFTTEGRIVNEQIQGRR